MDTTTSTDTTDLGTAGAAATGEQPAALPAAEATPAAPTAPAAPASRDRALSIIALVAGIAGIVLGQWLVAVAAIVVGFIARRREPAGRGFALWGIVLGFVGTFGWLLVAALGIAIAAPLALLGLGAGVADVSGAYGVVDPFPIELFFDRVFG